MARSQNRKVNKLSIVVPVFNEAENFPNTYQAIKKHIKNDHQILVVYDFDEDTTVPVAKKLAKKDPNLKLIKNTIGRGPLNALKSGFKAVKSGPILVVMADLSDDLNDVAAMLKLYEQGADIVCGSRYMRGGKQVGGPFIKRTLSRLAGVSLHYIRRIPTHDITNNFRLYDSGFLRSIEIESKRGFSVAMEITVKAFLEGKKIAEVPTTWKDRVEGEANFKLFNWLPEYLKWYFYAFQPKAHSHNLDNR
jgi:dolichol-phosphate mannosyltransferase